GERTHPLDRRRSRFRSREVADAGSAAPSHAVCPGPGSPRPRGIRRGCPGSTVLGCRSLGALLLPWGLGASAGGIRLEGPADAAPRRRAQPDARRRLPPHLGRPGQHDVRGLPREPGQSRESGAPACGGGAGRAEASIAVAAETAAWDSFLARASLVRIDTAAVHRIAVGAHPFGVRAAHGSVWVVTWLRPYGSPKPTSEILRLDTASSEIRAR